MILIQGHVRSDKVSQQPRPISPAVVCLFLSRNQRPGLYREQITNQLRDGEQER